MSYEPSGRQNGAAIRAFREKEGMSTAELARFVGLHPQALRNIENNGKTAGREALRNLARVLAVPVEAISRDGTDCGIEVGTAAAKERAA